MRDVFGRDITYMRVSITDRCNLRCAYCMPKGFTFIPHSETLRYEEILRVCASAAKIGIQTIKVTGGEPLVRKDCVEFIKELKASPGISRVTLTTNGVLLKPHVEALVEHKLDGLNISLDSLNPETYRQITGRDTFHQVWEALVKSVDAGLRVKINCVPIRGVNEVEIIAFAQLAQSHPIDIRFIELMPTYENEKYQPAEHTGGEVKLQGIPAAEIVTLLSKEYPDFRPDASAHGFGPARYFQSDRLKGGIGFISAISNHFCASCNRLRLTSEGFLKLCLYHTDGLDLRQMLRSGAGDDEIQAAIARAVYNKPKRHCFGDKTDTAKGIRKMSRIGG